MANERTVLQQLAGLRLEEATVLVKQGQHSGAYYVSEYAVECALKARSAAQFRAHEIPDKNLVNKIYTHDLADLLRLAGLEAELDTAIQNDPALDRRWSIVKRTSKVSSIPPSLEDTTSKAALSFT